MQNIMDKLRLLSYRDSTKTNYYGIWKNFNEFYLRLDKKPTSWEERLVLFVGYLIQNKKKSSAIRCYVSAIKAVLRDDGRKMNTDDALLTALTRACRLHYDTYTTRLPIRKDMLHMLIRSLDNYFANNPQPYLVTLFRAMFCMAYFGLFRIGEIAQGVHVIKAKDVHVGKNKDKLMFVLYSSKTHSKGVKPQIIKINALRQISNHQTKDKSQTCPFNLIKNYVAMRRPYKSETEQFFILRDNSPVTQNIFRPLLKNLIKFNSLECHAYMTQAFRAGSSCDLYDMGVSVETIKKLGRWKSNAVFAYIKE